MKQQAEYIALHTRLNVAQYIGSMNVDSWSRETWNRELETNQVLVMTMTIFKNLILQNVMRFSQINLLIFDECHHAVKNHDYVQIMQRFNEDPARLEESTRILGLTASLIPSKCKPGDLEGKIEDLEKTLCCRSQTAEDLKEVAKFATNPTEIKLFFNLSENDPDVYSLKHVLNAPVNFLEDFSKEKKASEFYELVKLNLEDCLHILLNLGIWCAHEFAMKGLADLTEKIRQCAGHYESEWEEMLLHLGITHLQMFVSDSETMLQKCGMKFHIVEKVKKLLVQLGDSAISSGEVSFQAAAVASPAPKRGVDKLVGIIFTQRRTTAVFLCKFLQHQSKVEQDLCHIKCDYVVGHDTKSGVSTYLRKEAKMKSKRQEQVLEMFRKGKINLVVSTSVMEEGVDVPKCNTVIRFDFPQNFRSYVQSKGRARDKVSKYILLIPREEALKFGKDLKDYNDLVKELEKVCHKRHVVDEYEHLKEKVEPYMNASGAVATINSSLSLVHRY